jgi:pyruvate dehydrogenase E2 component (dihydrolipoamide acetyltransferase)
MIVLSVPKLSMTMEEAIVSAWLVADGDLVEEGQQVVELETDKAQTEVEAPAAGTIRLLAEPGDAVPVEAPLAEIYAPGEAIPGAGEPAPEVPVAAAAPVAEAVAAPERVIASPVAKRAAKDLGVDLATVTGTGPRGRITFADVEAAASATPVVEPPPAAAVANGSPPDSLRRAVVANLSASWREIPHVHISGELTVGGLVAARRLAAERLPMKVTATDLLVLAVAQAMSEVPELNGTVDGDGSPRRSATVDLNLAVAAPAGVVAPTLRDVGSMRLGAIAGERARVVTAARAGTLAPRDLAGGTTTLSNLGAHPVDFFAPVITGPQIATIATGRAVRKPIAVGDAVGLEDRLTVNVAIDHRGADGEAGGRFLAALERRIAALPEHV